MSNTEVTEPKSIILRWSLKHRKLVLVLLHAIAIGFSFVMAFLLRFGFTFPDSGYKVLASSIWWVVLVKLGVFYIFQSYSGWWRYVTFNDLIQLARAVTVSSLLVIAIDYFVVSSLHLFIDNFSMTRIPRGMLIIDWGVLLLTLGGLRSSWRLTREQIIPLIRKDQFKRVILIGANRGSESLVRQIHSHPEMGYKVIGFLDEKESNVGLTLSGLPIMGLQSNAGQLALNSNADAIFIIQNSLSGKELRDIINDCELKEIHVQMIPSVDDLLSGDFTFRLRDVNIDDLLRRDPVELDSDQINQMIKQKTVMITGAGGSIGSEIVRQVLKFNPQKLLLVERAENNLFQIYHELSQLDYSSEIVPCIADITDEPRMSQLFSEHTPSVVFHAAAHKHVPMMEENPVEAVKNNVFGTKLLVELSDRFNVERFVMISTDKAVKPTSIMGATKQLAERYVHAYSAISNTIFVAVRFGNVLGSTGSVVPIFTEQIAKGGPVTVTHPDMKRFFMTIPEASQLVLQAGAMGNGGEIFVLDMGSPVKIVDLATDLIQLSGFTTNEIEIVYTGVRPGEKLYEELYFDDEEMLSTHHAKVLIAFHRQFQLPEVQASFEKLSITLSGSNSEIRNQIKELVPEFRSIVKEASTVDAN